MAASALTHLPSKSTDECIYPSWSLIGTPTSDTPTPIESPSYSDRSVQMFGAVGAAGFNGATITMQGSNDGTNWFTLTDPLGNNIALTASGGKQILENTRYIRPLISVATTGTTPGVLVTLCLKRR
jgi:hypothetical protein